MLTIQSIVAVELCETYSELQGIDFQTRSGCGRESTVKFLSTATAKNSAHGVN